MSFGECTGQTRMPPDAHIEIAVQGCDDDYSQAGGFGDLSRGSGRRYFWLSYTRSRGIGCLFHAPAKTPWIT
jgi:hypothetical protein